MEDKITLSVLIVGEASAITSSLRASMEVARDTPRIEALFVNTSAQEGDDPAESGLPCLVIPGFALSFRECVTRALEKMRGEWLVILTPQESLLPDALGELLSELQASVHGVRHGRVAMRGANGEATLLESAAPECSYPILVRWWLTPQHPHGSALFIRKALALRALQITSHHFTLSRYGIAMGATRCCSSSELKVTAAATCTTEQDPFAEEIERIDTVRQEISAHSFHEQWLFWLDYYRSCLTEPQIHKTPPLLPYTAAQAQALAFMLGEIKAPMAQVLWKLYQDVSSSKRAVMYLSSWSSIAGSDSTALSGSQHDASLSAALRTELREATTPSILLLAQNLSNSPLRAIAKLLRDEGRHGATIYTVSFNDEEYRWLFADLAHRGLLGWIRPAIVTKVLPNMEGDQVPSESLVNEFNLTQRIPQRALAPILENSQSKIDCVVASVDDPFLTAQVSHLAENITSQLSFILVGPITASTLGPVETIIRKHRQASSMSSRAGVTIMRCEALPHITKQPEQSVLMIPPVYATPQLQQRTSS